MRILCVLPSVPWAARVRSYNLLPRLAKHNEIHLVCVSMTPPDREQVKHLNVHCESVLHVPHSAPKGILRGMVALPTRTPLRIAYCRSKRANAAVRDVYEELRPDVVYVERWRALQFVPEGIGAPVVCDATDSMILYNRRLMGAGAWWERLVGWEEHLKFLRFEGRLARKADVSLFCSRVDLECVKRQAPDARCELVPNGVDCGKYFFKTEGEEIADTLIFTGVFNYRPNVLAVRFFLEEVFPLVRREVPGVKFLAVGCAATAKLSKYRACAGVRVIDFVPDLRPYIASAAVSVAPLTVGSGTSNKVLEAFATGTPVVATPMPCGDLPVENGEHLFIAGNARQFAQYVVSLLRDSTLRRRIAMRARRLVEEKYDWEMVAGGLEGLMQEAVGIKAGSKAEAMFATV